MPSSICWPSGEKLPVLRSRDALVGRCRPALARERGRGGSPRPEIGRDGDVGRGGDDAAASGAVALGDLVHDLGRRPAASTSRGWCGEGAPPARHLRCVGAAAALGAKNGTFGEEALAARRGLGEALEAAPIPGRGGRPSCLQRKAAICVGVIRPAWLSLWPGERQAEALDRVGDEAGRPVVVRRLEGLEQRSHVVAAEIGHQAAVRRRRRSISARDRALVAEIVEQPLAPGRAALKVSAE
jgi:hypothetical protein